MIAVTLALAVGSQGCSAPTRPPVPPSGGQSVTLDYATFASNVEPILVEHGCDATGDCHGGGIRGTLALSPPSAKDVHFDFDQVSLQVWPATPTSSPILTKPLALSAGGTPHAVKVFATTSDSEYQSILAWIQAAGTP